MTIADKSKNLRYRKPMLADYGLDSIFSQLYDMIETCADVKWYMDNEKDIFESVFDGDEDDEYEFKMSFSVLESDCETLLELLLASPEIKDYFDDCTVALIGNRFRVLGYDDFEEDYYSLTRFEENLAHTTAGKRIMRMPKAEMLSTVGQCLGILLSFFNVQQKYEYTKATLEIIRGENASFLKIIKEIEEVYIEAEEDNFSEFNNATLTFDRLVSELPEKIWIV